MQYYLNMKTTTAKTVLVSEIKDRDFVRFGNTIKGATAHGQAEIVLGKSVRLFGATPWGKTFDVTFRIGEQAEYDSYNLSYYGEIVSITEKTITVQESGGRKHRMSLYSFASRNYDFDLATTQAKNSDTMNYI